MRIIYYIIDISCWLNWKYDRMKSFPRFIAAIIVNTPWIILSLFNLVSIIPLCILGLLRFYWVDGKHSDTWRRMEKTIEEHYNS